MEITVRTKWSCLRENDVSWAFILAWPQVNNTTST